jgi:hypothetical protein
MFNDDVELPGSTNRESVNNLKKKKKQSAISSNA